MPRDFSSITEFPGRKLGCERVKILARPYLLAMNLAVSKRVLEVGCGAGLGLGWLSEVAVSVVAGDVITAALVHANATYKGQARIRLVQFDGEEMPFRDASFDLVVAMAVICYLDADVFLGECRRVLAGEGAVIFCLPNRQSLGFRPSQFSTRYYSVPELYALAEQHGFDLEIFGGFPTLRGKARLAQRTAALGGTVLAALPFGRRIRERIRESARRLARYGAVYLNSELTRADMMRAQDVPLVPLRLDHADFVHRVLYGVARLREGEQ